MNEHISDQDKHDIVASSIHDSVATRYRRLFVGLTVSALVFAVLAFCVIWYGYVQLVHRVDAGVDLAVQLQQLCDGSKTDQLSDEGVEVCKRAEQVAKDGSPGAQGPVGPTGPQGPQGIQGPQGPIGPTGASGKNGQNGATGANGVNGTDGTKGDTGATGAQGAQGPEGPQGATGPQGPKGDTGAQGPQGEKGNPGESAYPFSFDFTVDNVVGSTTYHVVCSSAGQPCEVTQQ